MSMRRITVTVPGDLVKQADRLAHQRGGSRSALLTDALSAYLGRAQTGAPDRVAEPAATPYATQAPGSLAQMSDDALLAELRRRLGAVPAGPPESIPGSQLGGPRIPVDRPRLAELCRRRHIRRLSLFGSVLSDAFGPDSDVDVLVEFELGHTPGLAVSDIEDELSALFGGRRVDLVTERSLHGLIRDQVKAGAAVQYAA